MMEKKEVATLNLYQRMLKIASEIKAVEKKLKVGSGNYAYSAVGEAEVLSAVKPLEAKHGVFSYPHERDIVHTDMLTTKTGTTQQHMRIRVVYRFVNIDDKDEHIDMVSFGDGIDSGDKAPGKAMTYADKYALLKAYKMITGDDPDQHASGEYVAKQDDMEQDFRKDVVDMVQGASKDKAVQKRIMAKTMSAFGFSGKFADFKMSDPVKFLEILQSNIKAETKAKDSEKESAV